MAEKIDVLSVNKFDGNNFHQWKFQIMCALKAKGLNKIIKQEKPEVDETKPETEKHLHLQQGMTTLG